MTRATIATILTRPADRVDTAFDAIEHTARRMFDDDVPARPGRMTEWLKAHELGSWVDDFRFDHLRDALAAMWRDYRQTALERHAATFILAVHAGAALTTFLMADLWGRGVL